MLDVLLPTMLDAEDTACIQVVAYKWLYLRLVVCDYYYSRSSCTCSRSSSGSSSSSSSSSSSGGGGGSHNDNL